ncbi:uncharacterized protein AB675_10481 [Cyphellophora attinorum]|uniref:Vps41 beta-propeller domain-containing protein n=1 Tax=Cyphellophora attinorum TaxID=1664694 RepID=A0A0N1NYE0_9EURO|nr:uncharacterized protein AB675_10481 [Phialophora attinorum]KPI35883.1 hypothetical protein AB675_10481 [Phialophora attinorum]
MAVGEGSSSPDGGHDSAENHDDPPNAEPSVHESEDEEEEEPRLKYANLTKNLGALYRNGDAASAFFVAGEKLIIGTHNGGINVLTLPGLDTLKRYDAHTASVSSISISPYPPPLPTLRLDAAQRLASESVQQEKDASPARSSPAGKDSPHGNVCVQSLVDPKDVQLRNFGRPVQSVSLSPEYKSDRMYLSGGQAGALVLTTGGQIGKAANASTTGTAAAAASSWLGSMGLGANTGTDKTLHSGEGTISTIRWSLSGKFVLWVNEQGIKIMRSHLQLSSSQSGQEWKRFSHIDRPDKPLWDDMAGVWKARVEWIDRNILESEGDDSSQPSNGGALQPTDNEEVLVGWGDTVWKLRVIVGDEKSKSSSKPRAEVVTIIRFDDCTISGVSLYTPSTLLVLAYLEKKSKASDTSNGAKKGRRNKQTALEPELRLIDINTKEEIDSDTLEISRFETLSSPDYHLSILPPMRIPAALAQRGYLGQIGGAIGTGMTTMGSGLYTGVETVGQGVWDATMYAPRKLGANRLFSTSDSVRSGRASDKPVSVREQRNYLTGWLPGFGSISGPQDEEVRDVAQTRGMKIFIFSPYDCIVAVKRNSADRLRWLVSLEKYEEAWKLLDEHPEAAESEPSDSIPPTPSGASSVVQSGSSGQARHATLAEFFEDSASITSTVKGKAEKHTAADKEKRQIGELWLKQLVAAKKWVEAGEVAGKALNTTPRWEHWVWIFIKNHKFDEISPYIPTLDLTPPLPSLVFEIVLGHYVTFNRQRFRELLDKWPSDIFDISSITTAIEGQLSSTEQHSDDWRILQECLAKLFLADGRYDEALRCYIRLQDADTALTLIKEHHLIEAIADDIPAFVQLRVSAEQLKSAARDELDDLASEPIKLLVDEAEHGVVDANDVVGQLEQANLSMFLFFYFRGLWRGEGTHQNHSTVRGRALDNLAADAGKLVVEEFADTAVKLFAEYDRDILNDFLHISTSYTFESALKTCESRHFIPELVYLLSKTGQVKKALFLIIDELNDVSKAIEFAREQDDKDLWDDFLEYSMSRPRFIAGLLAEVGTAIDPIELVRRIPSGIEIPGLKEGLRKMLREYDLQDSISAGVAQVLAGEVAVGMQTLRRGRRHGIKFDVPVPKKKQVEISDDSTTIVADGEKASEEESLVEPGHCASCNRRFGTSTAAEKITLVGFACGHVYHLNHLLTGPEADDAVPDYLPGGGDRDEEDEDRGFTRSIGPKVTNARLLREKIAQAGGCTVCKVKKERVKAVE